MNLIIVNTVRERLLIKKYYKNARFDHEIDMTRYLINIDNDVLSDNSMYSAYFIYKIKIAFSHRA